MLCFVLAGSLLGFLRWNFHPAAIFTGTSGVMFVGYTLAVLSILGTAKVAVALLVLGVPIIDTFWIIVRRVASRPVAVQPDRGHIHHRLLDLGLAHPDGPPHLRDRVALAALTWSCRGRPAVRVPRRRRASGLVLFVLTGRETVQEDLEAESYSGTSASAAPTAGSAAPPALRSPTDPGSAPRTEGAEGPEGGANPRSDAPTTPSAGVDGVQLRSHRGAGPTPARGSGDSGAVWWSRRGTRGATGQRRS